MKKLLTTLFLLSSLIGYSQEDELLDDLNEDLEYVFSTFETSRTINGHTVELAGKNSLDFRINHRFGDMNGGAYELWGLDNGGSIEIAFDYTLSDNFQVGIGRTSYGKVYNAYGKYRILKQTTQDEIPLSVTGLIKTSISSLDKEVFPEYTDFEHRMAYTAELMFARKFNKKLSLQVTPIFTHFNLVDSAAGNNNNFGVLFSGRYKFLKRTALIWEYNARLNTYDNQEMGNSSFYNAMGIGLDIETGGHVFQVFITNSISTEETDAWFRNRSDVTNGEFRLGFNVSRVFRI